MKTLQPGDPVPQFSLQDQHGNIFNIGEHIGQPMVIYFYPKDETRVCTQEACAFRDHFAVFSDEGILVIGINSGTVESHARFASSHRLPFILLSDPGNKVLRQFGIKPVLFITGRETFVVGRNGKIAFTYRSFFEGTEHVEQVLKFINAQGG